MTVPASEDVKTHEKVRGRLPDLGRNRAVSLSNEKFESSWKRLPSGLLHFRCGTGFAPSDADGVNSHQHQTANLSLGEGIATQLGVPLGRRVVQRFPGDELHIKNELRIVR